MWPFSRATMLSMTTQLRRFLVGKNYRTWLNQSAAISGGVLNGPFYVTSVKGVWQYKFNGSATSCSNLEQPCVWAIRIASALMKAICYLLALLQYIFEHQPLARTAASLDSGLPWSLPAHIHCDPDSVPQARDVDHPRRCALSWWS